MKLKRIKEILHVCEKTIDNYANRIGASDEIVEYIENLQSQLKAKEEENEQLKADYGNLAQVERDLLKEVIKEAREYIKKHIRIDDEYPAYMEMLITERDELDEILSKGENDEIPKWWRSKIIKWNER